MIIYLHKTELAILNYLKERYLRTLSIHHDICLLDTPIEGIPSFKILYNVLEGLYLRGFIFKPLLYEPELSFVQNIVLTEKALNFFNQPKKV